MRMPGPPIFEVDVRSIPLPDRTASIFKASIQVGGIDVFTRYYTNALNEQHFDDGAELVGSTSKSRVYDPEEASAHLLVAFGKHLREKLA